MKSLFATKLFSPHKVNRNDVLGMLHARLELIVIYINCLDPKASAQYSVKYKR